MRVSVLGSALDGIGVTRSADLLDGAIVVEAEVLVAVAAQPVNPIVPIESAAASASVEGKFAMKCTLLSVR